MNAAVLMNGLDEHEIVGVYFPAAVQIHFYIFVSREICVDDQLCVLKRLDGT